MLLPSVCTLALSVSGSAQELELLHRPRVGASRVTTATTSRQVSGGELSVVMNGEETPRHYLPDLHLETNDERRVTVLDTVERVDDAPTLLRRFDELAWDNEGEFRMDMGDGGRSTPWTSEADCDAEGAVLRMTPDREAEWLPGGPDVGAAPFALPLDLVAFLPEGALRPGETWEVDGEEVAWIFDFAAELPWNLAPEAAEWLVYDYDRRDHAGELTCTLVEVTGDRARCTLQGRLERESERPGDLSQVPVVDGTATETLEEVWDVEGELSWDVATRQPLALWLEGDFLSSSVTVRDPGQGGPDYEHVFEVAGTQRFELESAASDESLLERHASR